MNRTNCLAVALAWAVCLINGCAPSGAANKPFIKGQVEVAPGMFVAIQARGSSTDDYALPNKTLRQALAETGGKFVEKSELCIDQRGTNVYWSGNSYPVVLREHERRLYLIAVDRTTLGFDRESGVPRTQFRYYAQNGGAFKEIAPEAFPKSLAVQNISFIGRYFMTDRQRDSVEIARALDPADPLFRRSMTAKIWSHLATGRQYYQSPTTIDEELLREFARTNQPAKLTFANYFRDAKETQSSVKGVKGVTH